LNINDRDRTKHSIRYKNRAIKIFHSACKGANTRILTRAHNSHPAIDK